MGKQLFTRKQGFKRPNKSDGRIKGRKAKNRRTKDDKFNRSPSPSASEGSSEEHGKVATDEEAESEEEQVVYREPTMYDNLLQKLGSGSDSIANALKRRQREEEGKSDTEEDEDEDEGSEPAHASEGEEDGSGSESSRSADEGNTSQRSEVGLGEESESNGIGSESDGLSDTDEERDRGAPGGSIDEASVSSSSFDKHLGYKLSQDDVDKLLRMKWSYKWGMPAVDMPSSKWKGTGECFMKVMQLREFLQIIREFTDHSRVCSSTSLPIRIQESNTDGGYGLKPRLLEHWLKNYKDSGGSDFHSSKQTLFFSLCNSYRDILHHNKKPFYIKGSEEDSRILDAYIMHSLNHIFRTRDLLKKNNEKLAKHQERAKGDILHNDGFLDRGFTRPKVLILLPLASIAHRVVKRLIKLTPFKNKTGAQRPEAIVENFNRFDDEFGTEDNEHEDDIENSKSKKPSKPSDFQALFGGNNNDHFMIGIKFTRGNIKLYSDFYSSDMIVASPLGLITKIGEADVVKEKDIDYLSSIEVLIIDHADVILMQNWSHVNTVVEQLNRIPSKQHGTDIMRIRQWYLDGQARFYRQTIILGSHLNPDINALFNHHCLNYEGKVRLACEYKGVLPKVIVQAQQVYHRFDADSYADADDDRLKYFSEKVFPKIKDSIQGGIMIFTSSYFEFVRLRNFLKSQDASFCLLGEYTKQSDISRARVWFFQGQRKMMLYTERAHFYHRYKIRGIQNLIIYSLPERKEFYPEIVNMLEGSHNMTCTVLYSRFDQLRLERVVGSAAAKRMVTSQNGVFVFEHK